MTLLLHFKQVCSCRRPRVFESRRRLINVFQLINDRLLCHRIPSWRGNARLENPADSTVFHPFVNRPELPRRFGSKRSVQLIQDSLVPRQWDTGAKVPQPNLFAINARTNGLPLAAFPRKAQSWIQTGSPTADRPA